MLVLLNNRLLRDNNGIVIDNFCDFYDPVIKEAITNNNYKIYRWDIKDKNLLDKIFNESKIDVVVHLADMAGVRPFIENPVLFQDVNCMVNQITLIWA